MTDRDTVIEALQYLISGECTDTQFDYLDEIKTAIAMLKEQEIMDEKSVAKIKEPDCRICGQSHCKYYHESRKPTECKSYIRMEGR